MNSQKSPRHFLNISDFDQAEIISFLDSAQNWADQMQAGDWDNACLKGKVILTLFFENSTRTRTSFEMAAARLGATIIHWDVKTSSMTKDESFLDTIQTLGAMKPDAIIVRHSEYNAPYYISTKVDCPVINAGDSYRAHPTQALLDALTIRQHKGTIEGLNIAICGDVAHSRVASSNFELLNKLGANLRIIAPDFLMPEKLPVPAIKMFTDMDEGLEGCDVVMMLRIQKERMQASQIPDDQTYFKNYGLTKVRLEHAAADVIVMHPGPMNRNVEIAEDVPDDTQYSVILDQVANGVPARMAVLDWCLNSKA